MKHIFTLLWLALGKITPSSSVASMNLTYVNRGVEIFEKRRK
jgi:hypothetical protein